MPAGRTGGDRAIVVALVGTLAWLAAGPTLTVGPAADARVVGRQEASGLAAAAAVRVMGLGCGVLQAGSGTATTEGPVLTNRHVVADAGAVRVDRRHHMVIGDVDVGEGGDLAMVRAVLPAVGLELAPWDPGPGAGVTVAGYPVGRPLKVAHAQVVDYVDGGFGGQPGRVMRIDLAPAPGMSGGPVLDANGRLAGIVYAAEEVSGYGLVIPASTLRRALDAPSRPLPPGC